MIGTIAYLVIHHSKNNSQRFVVLLWSFIHLHSYFSWMMIHINCLQSKVAFVSAVNDVSVNDGIVDVNDVRAK